MGFYIGNLTSDWLPKFITSETLSRHTIYGVSFDGITHKGVRLYDAEGLNWTPSSTTVAGYDDFRSRNPFGFKRCLMKPGGGESCTINSYYDYLGLTPAQYNQKAKDEGLDRFIEYDCYYYSRPNKWTWLISPDYIDGFYPCPACSRGSKILSKFYMSEYMPNSSYRMLEGYYPLNKTSINTFRTNLRARGYRVSDYANYQSVVILALIKYADLNFGLCLGQGWTSTNSTQISFGDNILGDDGYSGATKNVNASIKSMGVVDLYANQWKHCDGIFHYDRYVYVNDDLDNITEYPTMSTWEAMGYKKVGIRLAPYGSNVTFNDIAYDSQFPWMTYPTGVGGDSTNPIGANYWIYDMKQICTLAFGAANDKVTFSNAFGFACNSPDDNGAYHISCLATAFPK